MTTDTTGTPEAEALAGFAPCPTCKQYSHTIGTDKLSEALMHFETMIAHPVRGHPMGYAFDEKTRDAAQTLIAAARLTHPQSSDVEASEFRDRIAMAISNHAWSSLAAFQEWASNHSTYPNAYKCLVDQRYASADRVIAFLRALPHPAAPSTGERTQNAFGEPIPDVPLSPYEDADFSALATRPTDAARRAALEEAAKVTERLGECANYSGKSDGYEAFAEDIADAIRALAQEQPSLADGAPAGYVLVPREPTEAMKHAGGFEVSDPTDECRYEDEDRAATVWSAMLAAIPTDATRPSDAGEVAISGETLFKAFMVGDVGRLTTTALPSDWPCMKPSYRKAWDDLAAALSSLPADGGQS